ncbi:uncharacterized protein LOC124891127 [Capsicum annuum]|uniref:uncharacterized protein LOC124891127 n=1 Tax=Capsicum annuum TaxID=4072 RepID=UPI001FB0AFA2|nr:uncharacterized protein LOC124891127 [Capsicum annuum]
MEMFIQGEYYELLESITVGPTIQIKLEDGQQFKKVRSEFIADDLAVLRKNASAKNILVCRLGLAEYNKVSTCITAKQIWYALVNAHESTTQVRKIKIALLFTKYKDFMMKENESLHQMMSRLTALTNELTSLGKLIPTTE